MMDTPHVTVAAIACKDNKFLFVKEKTEDGVVYNQPAGHLQAGESLLQAVIRETLEETAWHIKPLAFLGVSRYLSPGNGITYIRNTFSVQTLKKSANVELDDGIISTHWLSLEEASKMPLRSPLVLRDVHLFLTGTHYPLSLVYDHPSINERSKTE